MTGFILFAMYFITAMVLMAGFVFVYEKVTPYREFQEIKNGNIAAAIALVGAILGFSFPLISTIFFTHDLLEMIKWAVITGTVQLGLFMTMHRMNGCGNCIAEQKIAPAILLAGTSIAVGMINAICISY